MIGRASCSIDRLQVGEDALALGLGCVLDRPPHAVRDPRGRAEQIGQC